MTPDDEFSGSKPGLHACISPCSEVDRFPTARILQSLLTGYVRRFNKTHRRRGHLFEGRYKAIVCDPDSYLLELVRYIHLNPVRAAMVKRPGECRWSGHREYLGKEKSETDS